MESNKKDNILLLATTSYAGMGPYVASIINSFDANDNVCFFLVEDKDRYYSKNIKNELLSKCQIIQLNMNKFKTLANLTIHPKSYYGDTLRDACERFDIKTIHCLTPFFDVSFIKWFHQKGIFMTTVHDLHQHEFKKSLLKEFREKVLFKRIHKCILESKCLVTNSISQFQEIKHKFPDKKSYHFPFPTLITDTIANGSQICEEIKGVKDYILFFGRIEEYKGLSILIDAYISSGVKEKLVIAGKGEFAGKKESSNIIYIDRYITDEEIRPLYMNAKYIVYPYISATQSGVLSVASYFGKPMILSNVSFFKESIGNNQAAILFEAGNSSDLAVAMQRMNNADSVKMSNESNLLYKENYTTLSLKESLLKIYKENTHL